MARDLGNWEGREGGREGMHSMPKRLATNLTPLVERRKERIIRYLSS